MIFCCCIIDIQFIAPMFSHVHKPCCMFWEPAKLRYFTEGWLNMSLMCSLFIGWGKKACREELDHTIWIKWKSCVMSLAWPHCVLLKYLLFGCGETYWCYPVSASSKWVIVCFRRSPFSCKQERISNLWVLWYQKWSVFRLWPRIVPQTFFYCACWVPLHNHEKKHNLISTFIYRTDCSNEAITVRLPHRLFLVLRNFSPIHSLKKAGETMQMRTSEQMNVSWMLLWWENVNEDEWVNECLMSACLMKRTY